MYKNPAKLHQINVLLQCQCLRQFSKHLPSHITSNAIRQKFLEYFASTHNHHFVRSSPVVPYCDPTVAFVNAGMNQFKGIFLDTQRPKFARVTNSQKCVRVGGKHNDLNAVGTDGYHHTFFEMLGNWSFGDYFKPEACRMAWELLTNVYNLPASRLYVTYFRGDEKLGLLPDYETREIWRQIGVVEDRILPFDGASNFWEMGLSGPCGPCTEIHIDHRGTNNRAQFVNKGLHDLTEIWNIVFIEYNRSLKGNIEELPQKHVDTGMGLERLCAVLQGRLSNYDTDLFSYLLKAIHRNCPNVRQYSGTFGENDWDSLDLNYRVLADHTRMITACLADGVIPEQNQKLRRIMRRAFQVSENAFRKQNGFVRELSKYVIEELGPIYPEMERNAKQIEQIIDYEEDVYKTNREVAIKEWDKLTKENPKLQLLDLTDSPNVVAALKELLSTNLEEITGELAFKLYDTHGIDEDQIANLSATLNLPFNSDNFNRLLAQVKLKSKQSANNLNESSLVLEQLLKSNLPKTDDRFKYVYNSSYEFEPVDVKVLQIFKNNVSVPNVTRENYCALLLDRTNLYSEAGGQASDSGAIQVEGGVFQVTATQNLDGHVLHHGYLSAKNGDVTVSVDSKGVLTLNNEQRMNCMRNHTGTHLLNAVLKEVKGVTCQKSSQVNDSYLTFDVATFADKLNMNEVMQIEERIVKLIKANLPVAVRLVDSQDFMSFDEITVIPGEVYPDRNIRIVSIQDGDTKLISREPCCGTHVHNTADIIDFCIVAWKSLGRSSVSLTAVTGGRAVLARANGSELIDDVISLQKNVNHKIDMPNVLEMAVHALKVKLQFNVEENGIVPVYVKRECLSKLDDISRQIKEATKDKLRDFIEIEMRNALESNVKRTKSNKNYMIHYLRSSMILETVPLQKATNLCHHLPVLVISYADNVVKARCVVPEEFCSINFTAEKWLSESVASVFKSRAAPPRGQDGALVCNMKAKRVHLQEWDTLLNESLQNAEKFVEENL